MKKIFFLVLYLCAASLILSPTLDFQYMLSTGDHGRDLYAASVAFEGQAPYKDYWWVYGPLTPYYYGFFYNAFGHAIHSILIGKTLLVLGAGLFFYLILAAFITPSLAFLGSLWFIIFFEDFFFTYNHIAGVTASLAATYLIFLYIKNQKLKYAWGALWLSLVLALIKVNFGLGLLGSVIVSVWLIDWTNKNPLSKEKIIFYIVSIIALPSLVFFIYYLLLKGLPIYAMRQCLPYLGGDQPYSSPISESIKFLYSYTIKNLTYSYSNIFWAMIVIFSTVQTLYLLFKVFDKKEKNNILLAFIILTGLYLINLHEFLVSAVLYRSFWARPYCFLLMFLLIGLATQKFPKVIRLSLYAAIIFILSFKINSTFEIYKSAQIPAQYLSLPRAQIYVGNHPGWVQTAMQTTKFLNKSLKSNETFFALPYDPLYYFLTDKKSPSRQLIFFEHIKIPPEQEISIIEELEKNHVNWIALSNRMKATEHGLGILGETYCPILGEYIKENFTAVAEFGDWTNDPGWAWHHGMKVLKRR